MTANDIFEDAEALRRDLELHESILWSKAILNERLAEQSRSRDPEHLATLRIEAAYQLCEFFYLLRARGIETADEIGRLADIHNMHIEHLCRDREKMKRLGVRHDRLLDAIFTADTLPRLRESWARQPGSIDQSNLARFLVTVMSTETCRKLAVAFAEAGYLDRSRSSYGTVLLRSTGALEQIFGGVLRDLRSRILGGHDHAR